MKKLAPLVALGALAALSGCSLQAPTWQVVGVYTDPSLPGALPADAAGAANFRVHSGEFRGSTPCASVRGELTIDGDTLTLDFVELDDPGDCSGGARHTHDQLAGLLTPGASFHIVETAPTERLLVENVENVEDTDAGSIDRPSVRLVKL